MLRPRPPREGGWSRTRLWLALAGVALMLVGVLAGAGFLVVRLILGPGPSPLVEQGERPAGQREHPPAGGGSAAPTGGSSVRDAIAAAPMPWVPADAARSGQVGVRQAPTLLVPAASTLGPAGVPSGFPQTPAGAVGQLAAIRVSVLEAMSLPHARAVYRAWALPGGVGEQAWSATRNIQAFLTAARQEGDVKDDTTLVQVLPAAGQVKGMDGPDWVVACVLLDVRASAGGDARIGYGTCERMQWTAGGWRIAPGTPPAPAPSVWPGSDLALDVGWLAWREGVTP